MLGQLRLPWYQSCRSGDKPNWRGGGKATKGRRGHCHWGVHHLQKSPVWPADHLKKFQWITLRSRVSRPHVEPDSVCALLLVIYSLFMELQRYIKYTISNSKYAIPNTKYQKGHPKYQICYYKHQIHHMLQEQSNLDWLNEDEEWVRAESKARKERHRFQSSICLIFKRKTYLIANQSINQCLFT